jgi:dihydrofolate reductase
VTEYAPKTFSLVVAMDRNRGIGNRDDLPWPRLKGDMKFFRDLTTHPERGVSEARHGLMPRSPAAPASGDDCNAVLMGRKTWESLPRPYRPLPGRLNGVFSRSGLDLGEEAEVWESLDAALSDLEDTEEVREVFVIGGGQIFAEAVRHPDCARLYVTEIDAEFECDTFFPRAPGFKPVASSPWIEENGIRYRFTRWERKA